MKNDKRQKFIEAYWANGCVVYKACADVGIARSTFYEWYAADPDFHQAIDDAKEAQTDWVENKLMRLIDGGDTFATTFYLKTRGRDRGWNDRLNLQIEMAAQRKTQAERAAISNAAADTDTARRIKQKHDYLVKMLKKEGKYTPTLSEQARLVASLLVRTEQLAREIFSPTHSPVNVEISREGNERESVSPKERLYLDYLAQSQRALKALGMNTDSKEGKAEADDGFTQFMEEMRKDD